MLRTECACICTSNSSGIASDQFDHLGAPQRRAPPAQPATPGRVAHDELAACTASVGNLVIEELGVKVTAALAVRFPLGGILPGTNHRVGRRDDVGHFAPIGRDEVQLLSEGTLEGLTTLCRISFTFGDAIRIPGEQLFRKVVCDRCLIATQTLPELLLL